MQRFEYKVVPAPRRGEKARGVKSTEERFALGLTHLMNAMAAEGWDYVRAEALPCDERAGLTGTRTTFQNVLVFRRALAAESQPEGARIAIPDLRGGPEAAGAAALRIGATDAPEGRTPSLGPAKSDLAAE